MSVLADDLACIFTDTSLTVSVKAGARCTRGFLSTRDATEIDGQGMMIVVPRRAVTILDGSLPDLASGDALTVDDAAYRLHGPPMREGRGKVTLTLAEDRS